MLAELEGAPIVGPVSDFHRAIVHVGLGAYDEALALLERAALERTRLVMLLKVEPKFEPLRGDPRAAPQDAP